MRLPFQHDLSESTSQEHLPGRINLRKFDIQDMQENLLDHIIVRGSLTHENVNSESTLIGAEHKVINKAQYIWLDYVSRNTHFLQLWRNEI